jgi:hypothetical protein
VGWLMLFHEKSFLSLDIFQINVDSRANPPKTHVSTLLVGWRKIVII